MQETAAGVAATGASWAVDLGQGMPHPVGKGVQFRALLPGLSCFLREGDRVYHTYSTYGRGLEWPGGTYYYLDLTALGRQED